MIKNWSKFNENADNLEGVISDKFSEVRDILIELEDDDILNSYSISIRGEDQDDALPFNPKTGDFNRWFELSVSQIKNKIDNRELCIVADLRLPIFKDKIEQGRVSLITPVIDSEGIKKFEDILVCNSRLTSAGYKVNYSLNGNHHEYKPLKMLIYFSI